MNARRAVLAILAVLGACTSVQVTPSGSNVVAKPRGAGCAVEFLRARVPERPYDEIAGLHAAGSYSSAASLQEEMRAKACEVGADAVVITRDFIPGTQSSPAVMTGTAVKYREPAAGK